MAEIIQFNRVSVWIPQKLIRKCFKREGFLKPKECLVLDTKLREIEENILKLQHARSAVEVCLWKRCDNRAP
jgi:hypothetical protein